MMIVDLIRGLAFGFFMFCALVALASWAVMTRRINPFSRVGRTIRRLTDPILEPVERWLLRRGGNPRNAGWWILGGSVVGGIIAITLAQWIVVESMRISYALSGGPRGVLRLAIAYASRIVMFALIVRVIGSWFGVGRFNRWMRPAYVLTDWIVDPLRKIVPPIGMIDITPLVAWFLLMIVSNMLLRFL